MADEDEETETATATTTATSINTSTTPNNNFAKKNYNESWSYKITRVYGDGSFWVRYRPPTKSVSNPTLAQPKARRPHHESSLVQIALLSEPAQTETQS